MKKILSLLLLLITLNAFAQGKSEMMPLPDSLVGRLKEHRKTDLARAEALDAAITYYYEKVKILDAQGYIRELSQLANDLRDNYYIALSEYYLSLCALERLDYEAFPESVNKALERLETLRLTNRTALLASKIYLAKSSYYLKIDMLPESYDAIQKGLEMAGDNKDMYYKLRNNLGNLYLNIEDYSEAEKLFREALKLKKTLPYRNLATIHCIRGDFDSALVYIDSAFSASISLNDSLSVMHFQGAIHLGQGDLDQAEKCYNECLSRLHLCNDVYLNTVIYQNSAYISMKKGNLQQASHLIDTALHISNKLHNTPKKMDCIRLKAIVLDEMEDYENSLKYLARYSFMRDSLLNQQNKERVLQLLHQQEIKEVQNLYETEKTISKQRQNFVLIIAALITLFTIMITYFLVKNRRQKELLLKQELDLRTREVTSDSIGRIRTNEILNDAINKLSEMEEHPEKSEVPSIIRNLKTLVNDDARNDFDLHFVQIHPDFYQKLLAEHPKLTQNELRLCAFIKSNLSIKEIAAINGISAESVKTARKRLRKSLNLTGEDVSLLEFLSKY